MAGRYHQVCNYVWLRWPGISGELARSFGEYHHIYERLSRPPDADGRSRLGYLELYVRCEVAPSLPDGQQESADDLYIRLSGPPSDEGVGRSHDELDLRRDSDHQLQWQCVLRGVQHRPPDDGQERRQHRIYAQLRRARSADPAWPRSQRHHLHVQPRL